MNSKSRNIFRSSTRGGFVRSALHTNPTSKARSFSASKIPSPPPPPALLPPRDRCLAREGSTMPSFERSPSQSPLFDVGGGICANRGWGLKASARHGGVFPWCKTMTAWSVKARRSLGRWCRGARVCAPKGYGYAGNDYPPASRCPSSSL